MVFVTFMYGMFLPILFPICLMGLFIFYVVEMTALAYWYREPPKLDGQLDLKATTLLKFALIPFFMFGYWALGNA